ncbi:MAG: protein-specific endoprotease CAAX (prenyl protease 1) [Candidatus Magnetoglobus multicellularis str. Araruama]|uniref:Protein-specific endoprotease CAAX (Prenyl protease 1) n=1 Tax=Candidatus Magnetoglobus multicellularis str. Araruama TaxID=890399 RepID=A0A1V1PB05_9BACT|nr:MAG: protein-specific endoprotease CAAX (prenyl protease 1) [Candidatus Magnetoglobus multicellularis str. Araruama]
MFTQFIYFIVSLLIYSTYHKPDFYIFSDHTAIVLFNVLFCIFIMLTRYSYTQLEKEIIQGNSIFHYETLDRLTSRLTILGLLFYTLDIYALNLKKFISWIPLFQSIPTLSALCFLMLFFFYVCIVFYWEYNIYRLLHPDSPSRLVYIYSNLSFSLPMLLPWLFISLIGDALQLLPECSFKIMLDSVVGENIQFVVLLLLIALFAPKLVKYVWRCQPLPDGIHRDKIEATCKKAGVNYSNILYWPIFGGKMITAGVMGLTKRFRYILVTHALIDSLSLEELESVIAHEIGHVKKRHLIKYFISVLLFSFIIVNVVNSGLFVFYKMLGANHINLATIMFTCFMITFLVLYFRLIFGYFMRNFEREADIFAFQMIGSAAPLISAFNKITFHSGRPPTQPNWHHFSIAQRIAYLKQCEADSEWINRHDRKVKRSMTAYILGVALFIGLSFQLPELTKNDLFIMHAESIVEDAIAQEPDSAELYDLLGDAALLNKHYQKAIYAFTVSLQINPDNPEILNNLAWLYATCEQEDLRNPQKALKLAKRAVQLESKYYILDTLAEAYYVNGYFEQAVRLAEQVIKMDLKNPEYYHKQLDKFKQALL